MCTMEVASRHLILYLHLQLHHWTLVVSPSWDSPFPFKWVQKKVVLECEQPLDQARVMWSLHRDTPGGLQTPLKSRYPTVWYILYDWDSCVFKTVSVHIFDIYESCIYYRRTCRRGNTMHTWAQMFCTHVRRSLDSMKSRYSTVTVYTVWLRFMCVQCTYLCWCISLRFMRAATGMQAGEHCVPLVHRCLQPYCIRPDKLP